ncbi:MAG: excinuclease ABC subunit UvrA [Phycisphaerales bacterium]|nr:excinuclease ABC subunit UvrA [Phycisphaerales bacterium]
MASNHPDFLVVEGAREHNLKNINLSIPKNKLVVFTGLSGSGKSSLAFDTIYNEGQRRYTDSLSTYARQFIGSMDRPDVDKISGLSPVISIEQKTTHNNPRSTVGTITEIYDFLRLLYAKLAEPYSYVTGKKMTRFREEEMVDQILRQFSSEQVYILAPLIRGRKGHYKELFAEYAAKGFLKVRVNGTVQNIEPSMQLERFKVHNIELVVDTLTPSPDNAERLKASVNQTLKLGSGLLFIEVLSKEKTGTKKKGKKAASQDGLITYSTSSTCIESGISYEEPSPNSFSFNIPASACPACKGIGYNYIANIDAIFPDKELSIEHGGIAPIGAKTPSAQYRYFARTFKEQGINCAVPIKKLSKAQIDFILYGDASQSAQDDDFDDWDEDDDFDDWDDDDSQDNFYGKEFRGIATKMKEWYINNDHSERIKNWAGKFLQLAVCDSCNGDKLKKESLWFKIKDKNIAELSHDTITNLLTWMRSLPAEFDEQQGRIAKDILSEIITRLEFLIDVGLGYLSLHRGISTLSGGESQRVRLATQIGSYLEGITYILDEPSIGLHQRDNQQLIDSLKKLRDRGNSVIVVEHDKDIMMASDYIVDIGPGAGKRGGNIVAQGTPSDFIKHQSFTSKFLSGIEKIKIPETRRVGNGKEIVLTGLTGNNLKNITVKLPLGKMILITGVSGSGKSTMIGDTLYPILWNYINKTNVPAKPYKNVSGLEHIDKVVEIDQSPIGRTPRSCPATYCGFFTDIRNLFAALPDSKVRGYKIGRFSFNVVDGRCSVCEGSGYRTIDMNFLPDIYVLCEKCGGKRYNRETLDIKYNGKSIADVLEMTVEEAVLFFQPIPFLYRKLKVLEDVGLGYIALGQSAVTLSGGEAQRIKLSTELSKRDTGKTFYILDEPTTGLHFQDIQLLMKVLNSLVDRGNTVLIIEHNMDVIKLADHVIDLGPEGGTAGGNIVFEGVPENIGTSKSSITGEFLLKELGVNS